MCFPHVRIALLHGESRGDPNAFESVSTFAPDGVATRIEMRAVFLADVVHTIDVVLADRDDAKALGCRVGDPLLREQRRSTAQAGMPIESSQDRYLSGTVAFVAHNSSTSARLARQQG